MIQLLNQTIDVVAWQRHEEFGQYPEGARDKTLLYCPSPPPYAFLQVGYRYLFKRSSRRYPEQFWVEIFAYCLGVQMDIKVPRAFVAYDSKTNQSGALIEWFLKEFKSHAQETYTPGGDYCQQYFHDFDRKKGRQHNFEMIVEIFNQELPNGKDTWQVFWAKALVFDALIGNTDRHQDNWGIIKNGDIRIAPVFDNGTSMGHEIAPKKFSLFLENHYIENYISKGSHHMKWNLNDNIQGHCELLQKLAENYPEMRAIMLNCLKKVSDAVFKSILDNLVQFEIPTKLSPERASFMLSLLNCRHQRLLNKLEK